MLNKNNIIVIYGKPGSYKSSLGVAILNNYSNSCYINLDDNKHLKINDNVKVFREADSLDFLKNCIKEYDVTLIDYIELIKLGVDELVELKKLTKSFNKSLIIISCCSSSKRINNNDHYNELKKISDLMILTE
jgi:chromosomal replication initiation ATPase DnaA